ncbi:MAG: LytTR family transcriptional regulator [Bacteroidaceae bacterium]|nr:LytTR family transcriptional regulator [Bacteroidaceae bacterium]
MRKIPESYFDQGMMICYILLMPLFTFFYLIVFKPLHIDILFDVDINQLAFRAIIMTSIQLVCTLISRLAMLLVRNRMDLGRFQFVMWEFVEMVVIVMFFTLFNWLMNHRSEPYFTLLPSMFLIALSTMVFPYVTVNLLSELNYKGIQVEERDDTIRKYASGQIGNESSPIHFRDSQNNLKLVVAAGLVLYIEAANNYVIICYMKNDRMVKYQLRNKMKELEEVCMQNNLVRCHRSYFINLRHVKVIQKEPDGMYAELEYDGAPHIPVSKTYADQIIGKLALVNDQTLS